MSGEWPAAGAGSGAANGEAGVRGGVGSGVDVAGPTVRLEEGSSAAARFARDNGT
jgi:hypothetical protein